MFLCIPQVYVVEEPPLAVHRDAHAHPAEPVRPCKGRELAALIGVYDLWIAELVHRLVQGFDADPWAGLRPMMPNMMPWVRQGKSPREFYNTEHGLLGWTLSAIMAKIVSELTLQI